MKRLTPQEIRKAAESKYPKNDDFLNRDGLLVGFQHGATWMQDRTFNVALEKVRDYRAQYEKLRDGVQAIIDKANRDKAKVKVIYLEELLIGQDFVDGYSAQYGKPITEDQRRREKSTDVD